MAPNKSINHYVLKIMNKTLNLKHNDSYLIDIIFFFELINAIIPKNKYQLSKHSQGVSQFL